MTFRQILALVMEILSVIRGLRRRDSHPERVGIVERLSFRKKTGRGPVSPLPPRPPTMGGRGGTLGGRSSTLGSSGGLQIEERGKGDTLTKGGRQAQGENCFTTFFLSHCTMIAFNLLSSLFEVFTAIPAATTILVSFSNTLPSANGKEPFHHNPCQLCPSCHS